MSTEGNEPRADESVTEAKDDRVGNDFSAGPNPNPGGDLDTSDSTLPPYEGRNESTDDSPDTGSSSPEHVGGASGPVRYDEMKAPEPASTPGGATASPADEQPASEAPESRPSDPGVGPAHAPGTRRGEDAAKRHEEAGREDTGAHPDDWVDRPTGESSARDQTSIDPQEGNTDRQHG